MARKNRKRSSKKEKKAEESEPKERSAQAEGNSSRDETRTGKEDQSAAKTPLHESSFRSLDPPLSDGVLAYLDKQGFHTMTPVQAATIPLLRGNTDVAVQAVTGSGKTLAFVIPVVERIRARKGYAKNQIGALMLSPTRELAQQTHRVCSEVCRSVGLVEPLLLVGGGGGSSGSINHRPLSKDLQAFRDGTSSPDILIGTPGRVEDVLTRYHVVDTSELELLVLDEADVLLFGHNAAMIDPSVSAILTKLPKMRRTGIFSATTTFTTSHNVQVLLARAGMRNPVLVNVTVSAPTKPTEESEKADENIAEKEDERSVVTKPNSASYTPTSLTNYFLLTPIDEKLSRLVAFLRSHRHEKVIVFFLTCACVEFFGNALQQVLGEANDDDRISVEMLHGKLVQKRREKAMERFRNADKGSVLFCTDVAARGLDVADLDWVVQIDAPQDPSSFVHRVGRSARAGRRGHSLVMLDEKEEAYVDLLAIRRVALEELPGSELCRRPVESLVVVDDLDVSDEQKGARPDDREEEMIENVLPSIRRLVLKDRDFLEKGTKAFTSYIRAYKEHVCAFIFRFASLDLGRLATSFCLLRLPKMPELRQYNTTTNGKKPAPLPNFTPAGPSVDIYAIAFRDKARETARQARLAAELAAGGKSAKQIKAEQKKAAQVARQKQKQLEAREKGQAINKATGKAVKRGRHAQIMDEWEELAKEERLFKKMRRGKISKQEYEDQLNGTVSSAPKTTEAPINGEGSDDDSASS